MPTTRKRKTTCSERALMPRGKSRRAEHRLAAKCDSVKGVFETNRQKGREALKPIIFHTVLSKFGGKNGCSMLNSFLLGVWARLVCLSKRIASQRWSLQQMFQRIFASQRVKWSGFTMGWCKSLVSSAIVWRFKIWTGSISRDFAGLELEISPWIISECLLPIEIIVSKICKFASGGRDQLYRDIWDIIDVRNV